MLRWRYGTLTDLQFASKFICRFIIGERAFYSNEVENPFGGYVGMLLTELNNLDIGGGYSRIRKFEGGSVSRRARLDAPGTLPHVMHR